MKQAIVVIVAALVLLAGGTFFVLMQGQPPIGLQPAPEAPKQSDEEIGDPIVARARVEPLHSAALNFVTKGIVPEGLVAEVAVAEGDTVEKGALLARIDSRELQLRLEAAKAGLAQAQANYDQLMVGATPSEIAQARAQIAQAEAKTKAAVNSVTPQDTAAAQAQLDEAQANLALLESGPKATRVRVAQAVLDRAQARLQSERDSLSATKTDAQLQVEQSANELRDRQADYSRIYWENQSLAGELDQQQIDREASAQRALQDAEKALAQAQLAYEQACQAEITNMAAAEADVQSAQAALEEEQAGAETAEIAAARARVAQAEANLSKLHGGSHAASIQAASAEVAGAQAALEELTTGPREVDLAGRAAQVRLAEALLKQSELALELAALRAPIAGTIVKVSIKVGEIPSISEPAIILADLSSAQIVTENLSESNIIRVAEGNPVMITFDALPGYELPGRLSHISAIGENSLDSRAVTYKAIITPVRQDSRLRWNMSASVSIGTTKTAALDSTDTGQTSNTPSENGE
jgi:HlyD family secretion protein